MIGFLGFFNDNFEKNNYMKYLKFTLIIISLLWSNKNLFSQQTAEIPNFSCPNFSIDLNEWTYVVITKINGNVGSVYKNGALIFDGSWANTSYSWSRIDIGAVYYNGFSGWLEGSIDELRVSNTVRTSAEILNNFNLNLPFSSDANTVGLWHFDTGNTSTISATTGTDGQGVNVLNTSGKFGNALSYNGTNSRVSINQSVPTSNVTIEFWIKPTVCQMSWPISFYGYNTSGFVLNNPPIIAPTISSNTNSIVCQGDSVTLTASLTPNLLWSTGETTQSITVETSGTYTVTSSNCNYTAVSTPVNISVIPPSINTLNISTCLDYTLNGQTYNESGTYNQNLSTITGCDSLIVLNLDIHSTTFGTENQTAIDSYTWSINNQTYTQSGTYVDTIPNADGCDSIVTLILSLDFTGLKEFNSKIAVYPNPAMEFIIISCNEALFENFELLDAQGKIILRGKLQGKSTLIDLNNLAIGNYLLKIGEVRTPVVLKRN